MGLYSSLRLLKKVLTTNLGFFDPYELNFAITYRCNSRCAICNIWKEVPKDELSLEEIERMSKNIDFIHWIRLTGGEPFLRQDYVDIVRVLDENLDLFLLTTPTNGLLPHSIYKKVREVLKFFEERYIISVSLDGPEHVHERIRGVKGSWKKAVETYKKLKNLEKHKNFKVFFGYTISPMNLGFFHQTIYEVRGVVPGVRVNDFHVNLFQVSSVFYKNEDQKLTESFCEGAEREVENILRVRNRSFDPVEIIEAEYLKLSRRYLKTRKTPISCKVFNLSCFLDPSGNVYPCSMFDRKLGNVRESDYDLRKILLTRRAKKVKEDIVKSKCPQCWTPCEAHQMIISNWFKTW